MRVRIAMTMAILILIAVSGLVRAQSGGDYDLTWNTIDNGGATFSTGNGYQLGGTVGQPDAGMLSGDAYTLVGGFWRGRANLKPSEHLICLPLVLRNSP
jgi:hypothetical protein